jgi:transposase
MEACGSAHHWGRQISELGHRVVLLPPHQSRPYVVRNKTDRTDTKGLLEAHRNEDIHPVPVKSVEQQIITTLHRVRSSWLAERTAKINTLRGLLREIGVTIPVGSQHVAPVVREAVTDADSAVPDALRATFYELCTEIDAIEERMAGAERQLQALAKQSELIRRLRTIPGVGLLTATALAAFIGDAARFPSGRHFASYLGLTPRENSSGLRRRLGAISKRGDRYLRTLLVHGARSVLQHSRPDDSDRLRAWALKLQERSGHNNAAVALANRMARIAWALWTHECDYEVRSRVA